MTDRLALSATDVAAEQLRRLKEAADGAPRGYKAAIHKVVAGMIKNGLTQPAVALSRSNELECRKRDLSGIRCDRLNQLEPRLRILYVANATEIVILLIGERWEGRPHDVYELASHHLVAGTFDEAFRRLGLEKPVTHSGPVGALEPMDSLRSLFSPSGSS